MRPNVWWPGYTRTIWREPRRNVPSVC